MKSLILQLHNKDATIRYKAIVALGKMGQAASGAVKDLIQLLGDSDKRVSSGAFAVLKRIDSPEAVKAVNHYLENRKKPD